MATTVTLKPNAIDISGSTSGTTTLQASAVAGTTTLTLPAATDTLVGRATTDTLINKTLTGAVMNGTVGATTPDTGAFTTLSATGVTTVQAGTAALPAITTSGDTNTGIFFPAADTIAFTEGGAEAMRINSSGHVLVGTTSADDTAIGVRLFSTNQVQASKSGDWSFRMGRRDSTGIITEIYYNSSRVGDISTNGTGAFYSSASDYRLKENVKPMTGALAKVSALKPVTYKWKVNGSDGQGFIAHELAEVVPDAVRGVKDEIDADGNPAYQGIDTSFLVATLTAAIQELTARVVALEAA
jgi:hypothetical protein